MKRTAQNVDQYLTRKNKLTSKINALTAELEEVEQMIDVIDAPTKLMTGGFKSEDIIKKVVTPTDKLDKNGNVIKMTTFEFIYPETIIPVQMETTHTEPTYGSDFDVDTETITKDLNNNPIISNFN